MSALYSKHMHCLVAKSLAFHVSSTHSLQVSEPCSLSMVSLKMNSAHALLEIWAVLPSCRFKVHKGLCPLCEFEFTF